MFTAMAVNRGNFIRIKAGYGKHKILVKKIVAEKVLIGTCKYSLRLK